ncbi:MAG: imidazolonepropionase [Candidatus Zixiibacteriota bacterium]
MNQKTEDGFLPESEVKYLHGKPVGPPPRATLLIKNIGQLVTMRGPAQRIGPAMQDLGLIENAGLAVAGDEIMAIGSSEDIEGQVAVSPGCELIDAEGSLVTPGFVDSHTHPVFHMTREKEFEFRLQGKSYMEIAESGGGIRASVRDLRSAGEEALKRELKKRLDRMLRNGATTVEAKSGYGLSTESELLSLETVDYWNNRHPIEIIPTFLGAHEIPDEYRQNRDEYIRLLTNEMLPQVSERKLAQFCDVFCEKGVFSIEESRHILNTARKCGLGLKLHADELVSTGGAQLSVELGAISADHLVAVSAEGIKALSASRTVATLLPGTSYSLGMERYAPARRLIDRGGIVALATDCNPGSNYCESVPMIISLACLKYRMSPAEAISAATVNGAVALGMGDKRGQLVDGRQADVVIWDAQDYREIPYHYGVNLVSHVVKAGKLVF